MNAFKEESEQKEAMSRAFFESREKELIAQMESIMSELISSRSDTEKQSEALQQQVDLSLVQQQQLDLLKTHEVVMQKLHESPIAAAAKEDDDLIAPSPPMIKLEAKALKTIEATEMPADGVTVPMAAQELADISSS